MNRRNFLKQTALLAFGTYCLQGNAMRPLETGEEIVVIGSGVTALCLGAMLANDGA